MTKFNLKARILYNKEIRPDIFLMKVIAPAIASSAKPGQFCMLSPHKFEELDPLLRRPLSIHNVLSETGEVEFLYRVIGRGTKILSSLDVGDNILILGPLGNGFSMFNKQIPVLVGGGLGVAPLLFLARSLKGQKAVAILGAVTKNQLLRLDAFRQTDLEILVATEDGSFGNEGLVTEVLDRLLSNLDEDSRKKVCVFACGPMPMLRAVWHLCVLYKSRCQVSLETHMACGTGLCLGCAMHGTSGYVHVCKEGPCFDGKEINWDKINF